MARSMYRRVLVAVCLFLIVPSASIASQQATGPYVIAMPYPSSMMGEDSTPDGSNSDFCPWSTSPLVTQCDLSNSFSRGWYVAFETSGYVAYSGGFTVEIRTSNGGHVLYSCTIVNGLSFTRECTVNESNGDLTSPGTITATILAGTRLSEHVAGAPEALVPGVGGWQGYMLVW
ncbi:MAG: hypothetical protein LC624_10615 [Halobacteriales archaeon]|nr:hypothetical protein [Halobacteriales archaeon]